MTDKLLAHPGNRDHGPPSPSSSSSNVPSSFHKHHSNHPFAPTSGHPHAPEYPPYRGSISTERTSESGDRSYPTRPSVERRSSLSTPMDEDEDLPVAPQPRRVMGSYKLTDFFFHRTLGTGSFGRVHLGELVCFSVGRFIVSPFCLGWESSQPTWRSPFRELSVVTFVNAMEEPVA